MRSVQDYDMLEIQKWLNDEEWLLNDNIIEACRKTHLTGWKVAEKDSQIVGKKYCLNFRRTFCSISANTKHLHNVSTTLARRHRRWSNCTKDIHMFFVYWVGPATICRENGCQVDTIRYELQIYEEKCFFMLLRQFCICSLPGEIGKSFK